MAEHLQKCICRHYSSTESQEKHELVSPVKTCHMSWELDLLIFERTRQHSKYLLYLSIVSLIIEDIYVYMFLLLSSSVLKRPGTDNQFQNWLRPVVRSVYLSCAILYSSSSSLHRLACLSSYRAYPLIMCLGGDTRLHQLSLLMCPAQVSARLVTCSSTLMIVVFFMEMFFCTCIWRLTYFR